METLLWFKMWTQQWPADYVTRKRTRELNTGKISALKFTLTAIKAHLYLSASVLRMLLLVPTSQNAEEWLLWRSISHLPQLHFIGGKNKTPWIIQEYVVFGREGDREKETEKIPLLPSCFYSWIQSISIISRHIE